MSTVSVRPLAASSSTKAWVTLSLRDAWQPVPEQMVTQGFLTSVAATRLLLCASRSPGELSLGTLYPPVALLGSGQPLELFGRGLAVVRVVDLHHRSQGAAPQAVDRLEAEAQVGRRLPGLDAEDIDDPVEQPRCVTHLAGRPQADRDGVFTLRHQAEGLIERCDVVDLREGDIKFLAHRLQILFGEP